MASPQQPSKILNLALWSTQILLALLYIGTGIFKLATLLATLAAMWSWTGARPTLLRATGIVDLAGGLGIVLPALTRIQPRLSVLAALGLAVLQVCAIAFHFSRGEVANTPFNFLLLALALFVFWGRRAQALGSPQG